MSRQISRGDIYYSQLGDNYGHEQGGVRPVLIIQNNIGNLHSPTVIVAPITSRIKKSTLPTHVYISERAKLEKKFRNPVRANTDNRQIQTKGIPLQTSIR